MNNFSQTITAQITLKAKNLEEARKKLQKLGRKGYLIIKEI